MTKQCSECKIEKELSYFSKDKSRSDCLQNRCKACRKVYADKYTASHKEQRKQYIVNRKEQTKQYKVIYNKAHRKEKVLCQQKYRYLNPEKCNAHNKLNYAITSGRLTRPLFCSVCGATGVIHGHHEDYSKPLDVIWLCHNCHTDIHSKLKKIAS